MNGALLCLLFVAFAESVKLPPNFKKCNRKQPDLKRCVLEAARHAVPQMVQPLEEIGLPGLDPLEIPEATIRSGSGRVAVDQNFKNCRFHHLHEVKVNEFEFDFDTKTIAAALLFPQIDIKCEYKLNGTVLLLPIRGEGHSTIVLPSNFKKCNRKQPDLKECVLRAVQDAVPQLNKPFEQLNLPTLDPLEIPEVVIRGDSTTVSLDQHFKDCKYYGFNTAKVDKFEFDFGAKTLDITGIFPELRMECHYELDGKVLVLPIKGEGPCTIVLQNVKASALLRYEERTRHNKTYIRFKSGSADFEPGFMTYDLKNLFNGDKQLGDNVNKVLNENWKEVYVDVKSGHVELAKTIVLNLLNNFFSKVSLEEAFDD
ncbi:JHBP domain containing protein [Asbolus verrucosus]|uniref:JHBP domain containing protein n=1 Tax=Asbolus verrucosus TaxID=1661398 RepID=A0A482VWR0_ASBVE|nr:JHBP domain containing protein [Asbolus verrucosus]